MSEHIVDGKGLPCPQPVLLCKQCIEESAPESFVVLVDNDAAKENVSRFAASKGYEVQASADAGGVWRLRLLRQGADQVECAECQVMSPRQLAAVSEQIVVLITTEVIGAGDDVLGGKLMSNFLGTLPEMGEALWRIVLLNGAVKLTVHGSPVLDKLQALESAGVSILVCGTCLDHFGLLESKAVGQTTNMLDVVTSLQMASKVIRP